ncbi:hypothetical protein RRF57_000786 [Xylaria bambusicola]|uniref:Cyclic nucleotide-binding domain-containing protein n=1 Tax=Xylaria bambusicola TaxID=326684 RepID=A0AAN7YUG3_9PEZI
MAAAPQFTSVVEARQLVEKIKDEKGFLSEDDLDAIGPPGSRIRQKVENAMLRKDKIIGQGVLTLAKNLYTSNARFLFELLQNADDNNYRRAADRSEEPYVSFQIYPDKVILECNEDGFTPEDLRAICTIGESSKVGTQAYIGEKGIGFKSVFMAAWRVHIQSNAFSFTFTHRIGDSGIGMVSPVWHDPQETLDGSLTRITLFLHHYDSQTLQQQRYNEIVKQFNELQGTVLLFLRKIRQVRIAFYNGAGELISRIQHSIHGNDRVAIQNAFVIGNDPEVVQKKWYHVTKGIAENVPASENRSYAEDKQRADAEAEIVLAFPLTEDSVPIVENQDVFAFLPMRPMGFKFLMHTDFVTEASRQSIVTTSRRNQYLRYGIASCFIMAIQQFCQHPTLQFQWMRWLPMRNAYPWDSFWKGLLDDIDRRISSSSIFRCDTDGQLKKIALLRVLEPVHLDQEGDPLFSDLPSAMYLSRGYGRKDLDLLRPYGLKSISINELVDLISYDLASYDRNHILGRIRSKTKNDDWHSRAARLIILCLCNGTAQQRQAILSMRIIPLSTGTWTSASTGSVYYSHCNGGLQIPLGLDLQLVDQAAAANFDRRALFDALGVSTASVDVVRNEIFSLSETEEKAKLISLQQSVDYLRFMYLTHREDIARTGLERFSAYHIFNGSMRVQNGHKNITYLRSSDKYGPLKLLSDGNFKDYFIHTAYFDNSPPIPPSGSLSWTDWICQYLGVKQNLRLTRWDAKKRQRRFSREFMHVYINHLGKLMDTMRESWHLEAAIILKCPQLIEETKCLLVNCKGGLVAQLRHTYLPLPELERSFSRYALDEKFPFLDLPEATTSGTYQEKWGFLIDVFEVGHREDLHFTLQILKVLSQYKTSKPGTFQPDERFLELYQSIQGLTQASEHRLEARNLVKHFNAATQLVYIPNYGDNINGYVPMAFAKACVWAGSGILRTKYPLEFIYTSEFDLPPAERDSLKIYFKTILEIPDCGWKDYVEEIRAYRQADDTNFEWVNTIYTCIGQLVQLSSTLNTEINEIKWVIEDLLTIIRHVFNSEALIYVPERDSGSWYTVSQCIWSTAVHIQGRVPLKELYPDLEEFFTDLLGVSRLTLEMAYEDLKVKGNSNPEPPIQEVKDTIFAFNALLQSSSTSTPRLDPTELLKSKIFPIRYPQRSVKLKVGSTDFAIVDRELYYEAFASQIKLLDFNLDETRRLDPFINWLGLSRRYLSVAVKEISTIETQSRTLRLLKNSRRSIANKAHGLLRIATHYNSPRTGSLSDRLELYRILRGVRVYEADGIASELHISQDGHDFQFVKATSELHLRDDEDGELRVYVPRDPDRQDLCYFDSLPPRLLGWLMMDPKTNIETSNSDIRALNIVNSILNASKQSMNSILINRGIVDVDISEDEDDDDEGSEPTISTERNFSQHEALQESEELEEQGYSEEPEQAEGPGEQGLGDDEETLREEASEEEASEEEALEEGALEEEALVEEVISAIAASNGRARQRHWRPQERSHDPDPESVIAAAVRNMNTSQSEYAVLLNHVITRAQSAPFPHQGAFDVSGLANALLADEEEGSTGGEWRRRFHSRVPLERDMKIGAAGELFVFEMLSSLNPSLPNFDRTNWQSTIRKYVTVHPNYADMAPWTGRETADIVYKDVSRKFTDLLLDGGYLDNTADVSWEVVRPTYLIEVKTTTQSVNAPFFVSRRQFQRMGEHTISLAVLSDSRHPTIYVVFRVFNVDKDSIGVKIYVDPDKLRRDGALVFTEQVYSVTPGIEGV